MKKSKNIDSGKGAEFQRSIISANNVFMMATYSYVYMKRPDC